MQKQIIHLLAGPYWVVGRRGETYYLKDICELMAAAPWFVKRFLRLAGARDVIHPVQIGLGVNYLWSSEKVASREDITGLLITLRDDLDHVINKWKGIEGDTNDLDGYFELYPVGSITLFSQMDCRIFYRLLYDLTFFGRGRAEARLCKWRTYLAQPQRSPGKKVTNGHIFRAIRTTQERRVSLGHVDEYGEDIVRGRRRKLPSAWDDILRGGQERSWKCKKISKQWMKHR